MKFFSCVPNGNGFMLHETMEEARNKAAETLDFCRKETGFAGWAEEVPEICWGEVRERVEAVTEISESAPEGGSIDTIDDYALVPPPRVVETFEERMERLSNSLRATALLHCTRDQAPLLVATANLLLTLKEKP